MLYNLLAVNNLKIHEAKLCDIYTFFLPEIVQIVRYIIHLLL